MIFICGWPGLARLDSMKSYISSKNIQRQLGLSETGFISRTENTSLTVILSCVLSEAMAVECIELLRSAE